VANSSSSSFIIGFKKKPNTSEELKDMMFGQVEAISHWDDKEYKTQDIADAVFSDLEVKEPNNWGDVYGIVTKDQAIKELDEYHILSPWSVCGSKDGRSIHGFDEEEIKAVFLDDYEQVPEYKEWRKIWDEIDSLTDDMFEERNNKWDKEYELERKADVIVNNFIKIKRTDIFDAPTILLVEYEDHDSFEAFLEHGNIFRNLPHIRISKH